MKTWITASVFALSFVGPAAFSDDHEKPLTPADLVRSSQESLTMAKRSMQVELYDSIYAFATRKNADGDAAIVKLYYRDGDQTRTQEYFCHYHHESELDCHAH